MVGLAFSCLHFPYHDPKAFDFLRELQKEHQPEYVINLGDEADLYRASRYSQLPNMPTFSQELKKVRKCVKTLASIFPEQRVCVSNHPRRLYKRAEEIGLPDDVMKDWRDVIEAPATWEWRRHWKVDGILFTHGEEASGVNSGKKMVDAFQSNVCYGHLHGEAGVHYYQGFGVRRWSAQSGCLVLPLHPAFGYGTTHAKQPVRGAIVIHDRVPNFYPMGN